jgi:hypothetical protein
MKPYKLIPALVLQSFSSSLAIRMKRIKLKTSDYNKYLRVNGNESDFANKEIDFGKTNAAPNQKSYLGIIASKYTRLF